MTSFLYRRHDFAVLALTASVALTGCNNMTPAPRGTDHPMVQPTTAPAIQAVIGDYASTSYDKRAQGYDWVGVIVRAGNDQQIEISVRARSDTKKPTCHFDGQATLMGQDGAHGVIFQAQVNDSLAFFQFKDDQLTIDSQDKAALSYFCSGGGSLVGDYQKLTEGLEI